MILYYTILYYTILYYTILYYTILYYTIWYYTILYYTILYYTILYYTILYYTILYYTILYYTILNVGIYFRGGKNLCVISLGGVEIVTNTGVRTIFHEEGRKLNSTNSTDFLMDMPFSASEDWESTDDLFYSPITDGDDFSADE